MARGTDEPGLAALVLDQRIEADGRAVDAQVAIGHDLARREAQIIGNELEPVGDGLGRIIRGR